MIGWEKPGLPTPSPAVFKIHYNHVHDYGMGILSDFGGIYISSGSNVCEFDKPHDTCSNPTEVFQNLVRNGVYYNYGAEGVVSVLPSLLDCHTAKVRSQLRANCRALVQYMDEQVASINITSNM